MTKLRKLTALLLAGALTLLLLTACSGGGGGCLQPGGPSRSQGDAGHPKKPLHQKSRI